MEERLQFVRDAISDHFTMAALCARYGVSRRIGYKWLARYEEEGRRGLADRSRAPHHCPHRIDDALAELLFTARRAHPDWGARKLLKVLATRHPHLRAWPAPSTVADLLARRGLVQKRRQRRPHQHPGVVRPTTAASNDLWTADFKGPVSHRRSAVLLSADRRRSAHPLLAGMSWAAVDADRHGTPRLRARLS